MVAEFTATLEKSIAASVNATLNTLSATVDNKIATVRALRATVDEKI